MYANFLFLPATVSLIILCLSEVRHCCSGVANVGGAKDGGDDGI